MPLLDESARADLELVPVTAAWLAYEALVEGRADLGFLAIEPARAEGVRFTTPYVQIEGVFAAREDIPVDVAGRTIAVRRGSAYDLYLTRTIEHATIVRGDEAEDVFVEELKESGFVAASLERAGQVATVPRD